MKATDLRIGNLVILSVANVKHYGKIHSLTPTHLLIGEGIKCDYSDLQPIPLTEECWLKCGFINRSGAFFNDKLPLYFKQPFVGAENYLAKAISMDKITSVKYVHQLQNLFYSITGEELQVKL